MLAVTFIVTQTTDSRAYCLYFIHNSCDPSHKITGILSSKDIHKALHVCITQVQHETSNKEIKKLEVGVQIPNQSSLKMLQPFLD
jgi:hypothetical protein